MDSRSERGAAPRLASQYRRVFIVDSRQRFSASRDQWDPALDLVLTYDYAVRREVAAAGGDVAYLDHLVDAREMQHHNFACYDFFARWHTDAAGADIFTHEAIPFGRSFRVDYWNDYIFWVRARLCLERLRDVRYETLHVGTSLGIVETILRDDMARAFDPMAESAAPRMPEYFFPIHRWMGENIRRTGLRARVINVCAAALGLVLAWADRLSGAQGRRPAVLVQEYHPTRELIQRLRRDGMVRVVGTTVSRTHLWSRYIPLWTGVDRFAAPAARVLERFRERRSARLVLAPGLDLTEGAYRIIEARIAPRVAETLRIVDAVARYHARNPISAELLIANIGDVITQADCVLQADGVPSFLIANGILATPFVDDSKIATVINAYSTSVKEHYFAGMTNVVCLGDPRMDRYVPLRPRRTVNRDAFSVAIGASGHNNTDLNSYVAVEFEFLAGVLQALRQVQADGVDLEVTLKIRGNGYIEQYRDFVAEYFPGLVTRIVADVPMTEVLDETDLFISIYSQTLFEASCLGIASIYFRIDDEIKQPPFDGLGELVTVDTVDALIDAIDDFRQAGTRFDAFLDRAVMERYIGPLDGRNLERNREALLMMLAPAAARRSA